jgi:hypothetical protein
MRSGPRGRVVVPDHDTQVGGRRETLVRKRSRAVCQAAARSRAPDPATCRRGGGNPRTFLSRTRAYVPARVRARKRGLSWIAAPRRTQAPEANWFAGVGWITGMHGLRSLRITNDQRCLGVVSDARHIPTAVLVRAVMPPLPFPDASFEYVLLSHVYSHLGTAPARHSLLREVRRVSDEIVVVEQPPRPDAGHDLWEERTLADGSVHRVFKRYVTASALADELDDEIVLETPTFVAIRASNERTG